MRKVEINGPANPKWRPVLNKDSGKFEFEELPKYVVEANTLGEALELYCRDFDATIRPYDGKSEFIPLSDNDLKYFYYQDRNSKHGASIIDIHILKASGENICPKQDLNLELEDGDNISMGALAC